MSPLFGSASLPNYVCNCEVVTIYLPSGYTIPISLFAACIFMVSRTLLNVESPPGEPNLLNIVSQFSEVGALL